MNPADIPFVVHAQTMLDDNVVKGLAECVVLGDARECVEVGSYIGTGSTVILGGLMAARGGRLYCVDHFSLDLANLQNVTASHFAQFTANIDALGLSRFVTPLRGSSADVARAFPGFVDLVYVDASHDQMNVENDLRLWARRIRSGGVICGDDAEHAYRDGVLAALRKVLGAFETRGRFWWARL